MRGDGKAELPVALVLPSRALTHLHLHRLESPVSPEAEAPGKGERVHWIKHVTRVGQVSGSHAPAAATTTLG